MTDNEILHILSLCQLEDGQVCETCPLAQSYPWCDEVLQKETRALINRQKSMIEALKMDKEQLESDIINARMNLEHLRELYEDRACLCEEQDRQIAELNLVLANYPYMVLLADGAICAENHEGYERILASISANAVNEVLEELKNTLVINNEGNTEIFDYEYTLETIEGLKNKGVIFNV